MANTINHKWYNDYNYEKFLDKKRVISMLTKLD